MSTALAKFFVECWYVFRAADVLDDIKLQDMFHHYGLGEWRDATEADAKDPINRCDVGDRMLFLTEVGKSAAAAEDA